MSLDAGPAFEITAALQTIIDPSLSLAMIKHLTELDPRVVELIVGGTLLVIFVGLPLYGLVTQVTDYKRSNEDSGFEATTPLDDQTGMGE